MRVCCTFRGASIAKERSFSICNSKFTYWCVGGRIAMWISVVFSRCSEILTPGPLAAESNVSRCLTIRISSQAQTPQVIILRLWRKVNTSIDIPPFALIRKSPSEGRINRSRESTTGRSAYRLYKHTLAMVWIGELLALSSSKSSAQHAYLITGLHPMVLVTTSSMAENIDHNSSSHQVPVSNPLALPNSCGPQLHVLWSSSRSNRTPPYFPKLA